MISFIHYHAVDNTFVSAIHDCVGVTVVHHTGADNRHLLLCHCGDYLEQGLHIILRQTQTQQERQKRQGYTCSRYRVSTWITILVCRPTLMFNVITVYLFVYQLHLTSLCCHIQPYLDIIIQPYLDIILLYLVMRRQYHQHMRHRVHHKVARCLTAFSGCDRLVFGVVYIEDTSFQTFLLPVWFDISCAHVLCVSHYRNLTRLKSCTLFAVHSEIACGYGRRAHR